LFGNIELFERSVGLVILYIALYTSDRGLAELLYISIEAEPEISMVN